MSDLRDKIDTRLNQADELDERDWPTDEIIALVLDEAVAAGSKAIEEFADEDPCYVSVEPDLPSLIMVEVDDAIEVMTKAIEALK